MPIRAILFDKDGTLVDFQRTWGPATHVVLSQLCDGDARRLRARRRREPVRSPRSRKLLPGSPVVIETTYGYGKLWAEALGRPLTRGIRRRDRPAVLPGHARPPDPDGRREGVCSSGFAARGLRLGLMTNDADANTRAQLQRLGLDGLLEFVAAYDFGLRRTSPTPDPVLAFAKYAGVAPAEIAVVGDTVHDLAAARAAGRGRGRRAERAGPARAAGAPRGRASLPFRSRNLTTGFAVLLPRANLWA